ncbi:hypothetical protein SEUCBS139899_005826 [Sporothrix eucalyptigena]
MASLTPVATASAYALPAPLSALRGLPPGLRATESDGPAMPANSKSPECRNCSRRGVRCVYEASKRRRRGSEVDADANADAGQVVVESVDAGISTLHEVPVDHSPPVVTTSSHVLAHMSVGDDDDDDDDDDGNSIKTPKCTCLLETTASPFITDRVDHFFTYAYPLPSYSFLHPAKTRAQCAAGMLDKALALAICGLTHLHPRPPPSVVASSPASPSSPESIDPPPLCACRGTSLMSKAESLVWAHLERPTIARLQALLLSINHRMETGRFQRAFMLVSLAARFAAAMGLLHERRTGSGTVSGSSSGTLSFVHQEVRRRIVWSLKLTERYFSHGLSEFELCPFEAIYLQLPCQEEAFLGLVPSGPSGLSVPGNGSDDGAYRLCVSLESLRRDIMKMNRAIAICDTPFSGLLGLLRDFEQGLRTIGSQFPHGPDVSHDALLRLVASPWISRHVLMHLSWHQCYCDMYRLLLPGFHEAAPPAVLAAAGPTQLAYAEAQCLRHASAILDLLTGLNQLSAVPHLLEYDTAICAYQAALVVLFLARFGTTPGRPTPEFATSRADLCLAALNRFFPDSALARPIRDELQRAIRAFVTAPARRDATTAAAAAVDIASVGPVVDEATGSDARHIREKLAIHSLLRRADFADGGDAVDGGERKVEGEGDVEHFGGAGVHDLHDIDKGFTLSATATTANTTVVPTFSLTSLGAMPETEATLCALTRHAQARQHVPVPLDFAGIDLDTTLPAPTDGGNSENRALDFPLFPWYGLLEQDWSYGNYSE